MRWQCVVLLSGLGCLPAQDLDSYRSADSAANSVRPGPFSGAAGSSNAEGASAAASSVDGAGRDAGGPLPERAVEAAGDSLMRDLTQQQASSQAAGNASDAGNIPPSPPPVGATPPEGLGRDCASGVVSADGSQCYVSPVQLASWPEALDHCIGLGGTLARVEGFEDDGRISGLVTANVWLGGSDTVQDGALVWTDGTPVTFGNWGPGQPDGFPGPDCIEKRLEFLRRWYDQPCDNLRRFVCELPLR